MSASQNARSLLIAAVSTIVLFAVFVGLINIPALAKHSYALDYGWQTQTAAATQPAGECDRPLAKKGFPMTTRRPAASDPSGCLDETNPLAADLNLAICFALAAIISVAIAEAAKKL